MKLTVEYGVSAIALPGRALNCRADGNELKVLMYVCRENGNFDEKRASKALGLSESELSGAIAFWRGAGILSSGDTEAADNSVAYINTYDYNNAVCGIDADDYAKAPAGTINTSAVGNSAIPDGKTALSADIKENAPAAPLPEKVGMPHYDGQRLAALYGDETNGLSMLKAECERVLGKMLSPDEVEKLAGLYDYLGLECDCIMLLVSYLSDRFAAEAANGSTRRLTVSYIERTAYNLYREGIDTTESLQKYLAEKEKINSIGGKLRKLFGFGERALTKKQSEYIRLWTVDYGMSYELIEHAYNIAADRTNKLSLPYISKILTDWNAKGIKTPEEAETLDRKPEQRNASDAASSFDTDEFFEKALRRSYEKMKNDGTESGEENDEL